MLETSNNRPLFEKMFEMIVQLLARVKELIAELASKEAELVRLTERVAKVEAENARLCGNDPDPSTPSGSIPVYKKKNKKKKRRSKKPGRKKGHEGVCRALPDHIDDVQEHTLVVCPCCAGGLGKSAGNREKYTEDIKPARPHTTLHVIHRYWCGNCEKFVEPLVTDALPAMRLGLNLLVLTAWLHYGIGMTIGNIVQWLLLSGMKVSKGGLALMWQTLAGLVEPFYEEIRQDINHSQVVYADETGWRVSGVTSWLWCFCNERLVFYVIAPSRSGEVLREIFDDDCFEGVLVCDFYAAYNRFDTWLKQRCLVHLMRELKKVSKSNTSKGWLRFSKRLKRLLRDGISLARKIDELEEAVYVRRAERLHKRLNSLIAESLASEDADARRLAKRLRRHKKEIFIFLWFKDVNADNNRAERQIRPPVIMRKNSYCNRSDAGAHTQAVLMSVFATLKLRGENPVAWLKQYLTKWMEGRKQQLQTKEKAA